MSRWEGYETVEITLRRGLKAGGDWHTQAIIREASTADLIDAARANRPRLVEMLDEQGQRHLIPWQAREVSDILLVGFQVVRVGDIEGPLTENQMRLLTAVDFSRIKHAAEQLDALIASGEVGLGEATKSEAAQAEPAGDSD